MELDLDLLTQSEVRVSSVDILSPGEQVDGLSARETINLFEKIVDKW